MRKIEDGHGVNIEMKFVMHVEITEMTLDGARVVAKLGVIIAKMYAMPAGITGETYAGVEAGATITATIVDIIVHTIIFGIETAAFTADTNDNKNVKTESRVRGRGFLF